MLHGSHIFTLAALALCALENSAGAGEQELKAGGRKEFHLSCEYPYVYQPASYLKVQPPVAMRYGEPAIDCSHRAAPQLPAAAKGANEQEDKTATPEKSAAPAASPAPPAPQAAASPTPAEEVTTASAAAAPAYPVPDNAPVQSPKGSADFTKAPDEVVSYFRNPYNFVPDSHRFFDPIFEPAQPQTAQTGPHSTATTIEKP
jgi:hypothetical protein